MVRDAAFDGDNVHENRCKAEIFLVGDKNKEVPQRVQPGTSHTRKEFTVKSFFLSCVSSEFGHE